MISTKLPMSHPIVPIINTKVKKKPLKLSIGSKEMATLSGLDNKSIAKIDNTKPTSEHKIPKYILF